jgi:PAS domain S-box-containing protein
MRNTTRETLLHYGGAIAVTALAVVLRLLLDPWLGDYLPFPTLYGAVALTFWFGGYRPALLSAVLGFLACEWLFVEPRGELGLGNTRNLIGLCLYILSCGLIIGFGQALQTFRRSADQQRESLRITLTSMGDAVITTDAEGRVTSLNPVAVALTGWTQDEAAGRPLEEVFRIVNEQSRRPVQNPVKKVLAEGRVVGLANHTTLIAKDGKERPIDDSAAPIKDDQGVVLGVVLIFRDVTERRRAERSARLLASIVESSDDAIIGKDVNGVITSWNQGAERIFGYTDVEAVGRPVAMLAPPDRADEMPGILQRIRRGERVDHFDTLRRAKDGRLIPISLTVSPIKNEDGRIIGASKIARDVSERKLAEEALHLEKDRLHATLTGIGDAVIVTDAKSHVTLMNPVAQSLTGWGDEAAGRPLEEVFRIINEDTRQPVEHPVSRVVREGTVIGLANHTLLIAKDGTERPIDDSAAPIKDGQGQVVGVVLVFRDNIERRRVEEALRQSERRLAAELEATTRLHALSTRLLSTTEISPALDDVLENAILTSGADFGNVQLFNPKTGALEIVAQRGFKQEFLDHFRVVRVDEGSACAQAMQSGNRIMIEDVELDPIFEPHRHIAAAAGYRAVQSTPIKSRAGRVLGMLSTHFRTPHRLSERDGRLLDLYARYAADLHERIRFEESLREQAELLQAVNDNSTELIFMKDRTGRLTYANAATLRVIGMTAEQALGSLDLDSFNDPSEYPATNANDRRVAETGESLTVEELYTDPDGRKHVFLSTKSPLRDQRGEVIGVIGVAQDITDRKRAEEALRTQNERSRLLSEAAALLLYATDPDDSLHKLFDKIAPHFGLDTYFNYMVSDTGDALRLHSYAGIPQERAQTINRLDFGQAISGTVAVHRQPVVATHIQQSDDIKVQLAKSFGIRAFACSPLQVNNDLLGTLSFASRSRDQFEDDELEFLRTVCQYVAVAYERMRLVGQLREADRRKDEFLATLAHELRNPLAPIRSAVQILRMTGSAGPESQAGRDIIDRQVRHLTRLVDDLLDVSRISRGRINLQKQRSELSPILTGAVEASRPLIEARKHELILALLPHPLYVEADSTRLAQVFSNLLNNAAKFTEQGGHIGLTVERQGSDVVVTVKDSGSGIPSEKLPTVFEMFSQVEGSLSRSQGGLGIGLHLVKQLVEMHGGSVAARSEGPGKGSAFAVRLPVSPDTSRASVPTREGEPAVLRSSLRILMVDDNRDSADILGMLLRLMGNDVRTAYDGQEGLDLAGEFRPDVMLLDIGLPRLDGYEVCRRIREQPWNKGVVLIALTGWGQEGDRRRSHEAGFDHHMVKPIEPQDLMKLLAGLQAVAR